MSPFQETVVLWRAELARALRSGRVVALLALFGLFSAGVVLVVGWMVGAAREQLALGAADPDVAQRLSAEMRQGLVGVLVGDAPAVLEALEQVPIVVVVLFKLTLFFLPVYVALMGFDQVSGELGPRSLRFLVVRARRVSVVGGKFLAQATLLLGLVAVVEVGVFVYALATEPDLPLGVALSALARMWLATSVFSLAYVALTTLCSTALDSPALSLVGNFVALFGLWLANGVGTAAHLTAQARGEPSPALGLLRFVSPSHYSADLLHPEAGPFVLSALAYLGFAALFLLLAHLTLQARDV